MSRIAKVLAVVAGLMGPGALAAQEFPSGPVTLIIPFPPGGGSDIYARILADGLSKRWGVAVVTENIVGAGGLIGMANVAQAEPDGQRLALTSSTFVTNAAAQTELPFDPVGDLTLISRLADGQLVVLSRTDLGVTDIPGLVALAKERTVFHGSPGPTSTAAFGMALIGGEIGATIEAVNYAGGAEALVDIVGKRLDLYLGTLTTTLPTITAGDATPLFVLGAERTDLLPDVPTIGELGYPNATASLWYGVFGPSGMPPAVVEKINADIRDVMSQPDVIEMLAKQGVRPNDSDVKESQDFLVSEIARMRGIAERFNLFTK